MDKRSVITSRQNALVKLARAVRDGKERELLLVEGVRLCEEAARSALKFKAVLSTEAARRDARSAALLDSLASIAGQTAVVSEDVLESVSDTKTPQGVVALAVRPRTDASKLARKKDQTPLVVVMHRLSNPSNAGAMLRAAEAAGATGAITTEGSTDLFSPKALRGAMGATFRLPLWTGASFREVVDWCARHGVGTVSTEVRAGRLYTEFDWTAACAVLIGPEASGLTEEEVGATGASVRVPMREPVESLNAAVALAVVLYEAARQRGWAGR